jgi:acetolactate synthase-1/2/3 large subunit
LPEWEKVFAAYGIPVTRLDKSNLDFDLVKEIMKIEGPHGFIVDLDPEQLFYPKVTSRVLESGAMKTNPIHLMSPELSEELAATFLKYLK